MIQVIQVSEMGPTLNMFYGGVHFSKRSAIKATWQMLVRNAVKIQKTVPVEEYPVSVDCRLVFGPGKVQYDWDNAAATAKLFQDGLIKAGILKQDSKKYISGGRIWCVRGSISAVQFIIREGPDAIIFN